MPVTATRTATFDAGAIRDKARGIVLRCLNRSWRVAEDGCSYNTPHRKLFAMDEAKHGPFCLHQSAASIFLENSVDIAEANNQPGSMLPGGPITGKKGTRQHTPNNTKAGPTLKPCHRPQEHPLCIHTYNTDTLMRPYDLFLEP